MIEQFLEDISPQGNIEFSTIGADGCKVISRELALSNTESNVYFLGGVRSGLYSRAKDSDVESVSYIRIDVDIYNQTVESYGIRLSTKEILEKMEELKGILSLIPIFGEYKYMVFSGKGCHLYYVGDNITLSHDRFSIAMKRIVRQWDEVVEDPSFYSDKATVNLGRIMRLPGSYNQKNGEQCRIIYSTGNYSKLLYYMDGFAKAELKKEEEEKRVKEREMEERVKKYGDLDVDDNIYNLILDIPAYEISQLLLPQFKFTGNRNFLSNEMKGNRYTAFYYSEDKNIIINGGSSHYNWGDATSGWDSFQLVKKTMGWENKQVFEHFRKLLNK